MLSRVVLLITGISLAFTSAVMMIQRQQPAQSAWLAFMSDRDENWEIYRMRPNGSHVERLTVDDENDTFLKWTDDGQSIIFLSWRDGDARLYQLNLRTNQLETLPSDPRHMLFPNFGDQNNNTSPDGKWVVFSTQVTEQVANSHDAPPSQFNPMWSANALLLSNSNADNGAYNLFRMRADGTDLQRLSVHEGIDSGPAWSPNSEEFAFASNRDGNWDIYRMNSDSSDFQPLTMDGAQNMMPSYAPIIDLPLQPIALLVAGMMMMGVAIYRAVHRPEPLEFR